MEYHYLLLPLLSSAVDHLRSMPPRNVTYSLSVSSSWLSSITVQWRYCCLLNNKSPYNKSLSLAGSVSGLVGKGKQSPVHIDDDDDDCEWIIMSSPHNNTIEDGHTEYDQKLYLVPLLYYIIYTYLPTYLPSRSVLLGHSYITFARAEWTS